MFGVFAFAAGSFLCEAVCFFFLQRSLLHFGTHWSTANPTSGLVQEPLFGYFSLRMFKERSTFLDRASQKHKIIYKSYFNILYT